MIRSVVLDIGETVLDDTREWGRWADWLGLPRHTFSGVLGAVMASGRGAAFAFDYFRPGFDLALERKRREEAGLGECIEEEDLYGDVRETLRELRDAGFWVGLAGNQTARAGELLAALNLPVDAIATSGVWGVSKPNAGFFARVAALAPGEPAEIVYVGDHLEWDVVAARRAGLRAALIRRGPLG